MFVLRPFLAYAWVSTTLLYLVCTQRDLMLEALIHSFDFFAILTRESLFNFEIVLFSRSSRIDSHHTLLLRTNNFSQNNTRRKIFKYLYFQKEIFVSARSLFKFHVCHAMNYFKLKTIFSSSQMYFDDKRREKIIRNSFVTLFVMCE